MVYFSADQGTRAQRYVRVLRYPGLIEICEVLLSLDTNDAVEVMGRPDDKKLKSSMTLFDAATDSLEIFQMVLDKYYNGKKDNLTLRILGIK